MVHRKQIQFTKCRIDLGIAERYNYRYSLEMNELANLSFGEWLKRRRKSLGLTQEELAQQLNCSTIMLRKMEAEERRPSIQIIHQLAKILNISPSEQLKFQSFARGNLRVLMKEAAEVYPWQLNVARSRSNLPASITSFIGREKELSLLRQYILDSKIRLITLIGPPGVGKTRLGLQAARHSLSDFPDGVFFVSLAPVENSSQLAPAVFQALGYVESKNQFSIEELIKGIGEKQMLIMLDNLEHLIDDSALLASGLLSDCPHLKIIATSRESLRVPGEWLFQVPVLDFPQETFSVDVDIENVSDFPALILFAERARAVSPDFSLNAKNVQAVASICAHLDGVPLAIELIASRVRFMSPQTLLEQMQGPFIMYADGMRAVSARQKTLNNAIQWSYGLLSRAEQNLFIRLSVFSGGFTTEAAEAIFADVQTKKSVADLVGSLLDKSLIQRSSDEAEASRFNMLMMIREFTLDQLRKSGKESIIRDKHLAYFLELAEQAESEIHGPNQVVWLERIERNHHNFLTALDWAVTNQNSASAVRLLAALAWTWWIRGHYSELHGWFDRICALQGVSDHLASYAKLLNRVAAQIFDVAENRDAKSMLEESRQIWLTLGEIGERGLADCLNWMGAHISFSDGSMAEAMSLVEQGLEIYRKHNDIWGCAHSLFLAGDIDSRRYRSASSRPFLEQSLALFEQLGDIWGKSQVYQSLGRMYLDLGEYENARSCFEEMMKLVKSLQFFSGILGGLRDLGNLSFIQGLEEQARKHYEETLVLCYQHGMAPDPYSLFYLSLLAMRQENMPKASQHLIEMYKSVMGNITQRDARDLFWGLAAVAGGTNRPERSARLMGAGQAIVEKTGHQYPSFFRELFDRHVGVAKDQLGEKKFEKLASEGRAMTMEQAIAYALENIPNS